MCISQSKQKPNYIIQICVFYHRSKTNSSTNIMPVTHMLQLPKCSAIHCMDRTEVCCNAVFSFLWRKSSLTLNNWQWWRVCYAPGIQYSRHNKHGELLEIYWSFRWLGRIFSQRTFQAWGFQWSYISWNDDHGCFTRLAFFGHHLLVATSLEKGPKGHEILQKGFHF